MSKEIKLEILIYLAACTFDNLKVHNSSESYKSQHSYLSKTIQITKNLLPLRSTYVFVLYVNKIHTLSFQNCLTCQLNSSNLYVKLYCLHMLHSICLNKCNINVYYSLMNWIHISSWCLSQKIVIHCDDCNKGISILWVMNGRWLMSCNTYMYKILFSNALNNSSSHPTRFHLPPPPSWSHGSL